MSNLTTTAAEITNLVSAWPKVNGNLHLDFIYDGEEFEPIYGPDEKEGWFNSSTHAAKLQKFDTALVRAFIKEILGSKYFPENEGETRSYGEGTLYTDKFRDGDAEEIAQSLNA